MERAGSMKHRFQSLNLDSFIESTFLGNVLHNDEIKLVLRRLGIRFTDLTSLLLRANGGDDRMSMLKKHIENMSSDESRPPYGYCQSIVGYLHLNELARE